ncbi:dephospho-CoA kinase [Deltaproteobacteria bacterium Smac51]|nr:dephospho-CoA kinase [Deltaproteobacteria bacterium Smac51]
MDDQKPQCRRLTGFEHELEVGRLLTPPPDWASENKPDAEMLESGPGRVRLALTGGIATGKSTVARMFVELGAREIDFDHLARLAVEPGSKGFESAAALFGPEAVGADGQLNRPFIGKIVFSDPEKKKALESIIHPETWRLMGEHLKAMADEKAVVISVPLLFEAGLETFFSPIALVFASSAAQLKRLTARSPEMGEEQALRMMAGQWPTSAKLCGSTHVINNNGSLEETFRQVQDLWKFYFS